MIWGKVKMAAVVLISLIVVGTGTGLLTCGDEPQAVAQKRGTPPAEAKIVAAQGDVSRLSRDAAQLHAYVKKPLPGELKWQQIPWSIDLNKSIRLAKEENRPLLIWVSGDDPLERC